MIQSKDHLHHKHIAKIVGPSRSTIILGVGPFNEQKTINFTAKLLLCDINQNVLTPLKKRGYKTRRFDVRKRFPIPTNSFQQIIARQIMEHVGPMANFLKEMHRIGTADARYIIELPLLDYWKTRLTILSGTTKKVQNDEHVRMFFDSDVKRIFKENGFRLIYADYIGITKGYGYYVFEKEIKNE